MRKLLRRTLIGIIGTLVALLIVAGLYLFWYTHRPLPEAMQDVPLFEGITYTREIRSEPHPLVIHILKVDLDAPGISFLVTPGDAIEGYDYIARTTSQFLNEFNVQIAVNADGFSPWWEYGPFNYYPHEGDGTDARGLTVSQGQIVTEGYSPAYDSLHISQDNRVSFSRPDKILYNVASGLQVLVIDGAYHSVSSDAYIENLHPRTAIGLDEPGKTLIIVVVDGRQPNYSEGVSLPELAEIVIEAGGYNAINMDGGGSSALVMEGEDGQPLQLGSAIHTRIPGRERPIANHLGIFARPLP